MQELYFDWLLGIIRCDNRHIELCRQLFSIEFRWDYAIELDADRAENGKELRLLYFNETGNNSGMGGMPCTVLEMMIALSLAMENIMGEPGNDHPERWFWEMIDNLGLRNYSEQSVIDNVGKWMARDYDKDGRGGIFPLNRPLRNQRTVPIWEQAGSYMCERC